MGDQYGPTQPEIREVTGVGGEPWDEGVGVGYTDSACPCTLNLLLVASLYAIQDPSLSQF